MPRASCAAPSRPSIEELDAGRLRVAEKRDGAWHVNQWLKKAVLLSFRIAHNSRGERRPDPVLRQGAAQILGLERGAVRGRRRARGASGHGAARRLRRPQRRAHAELREHRRVRRFGHHGRHLGDGGLVRADRQERASVRRRGHRRRARAAAGEPHHHRGQLLHRRPLGDRRGRDRRDGRGDFHGRVHRPEHAHLRPRARRDPLWPSARGRGGRARQLAGRERQVLARVRRDRQARG